MSDPELDAVPGNQNENPEGDDSILPQLRENEDEHMEIENVSENPETEDDYPPHHERQEDEIDINVHSESFQSDIAEADRINQVPMAEADIDQLPAAEADRMNQSPTTCPSSVNLSGRLTDATESESNMSSVGYCEPEADHPFEDEVDGNNDEHSRPEDEKNSINDNNTIGPTLSCEEIAVEADMSMVEQNNRIHRSSSADDLQTSNAFPEDDLTVDGLKLYGNIQSGEAAAEEDHVPCHITPSFSHAVSVEEQNLLPEEDLIGPNSNFLSHANVVTNDVAQGYIETKDLSENSREVNICDQEACSNQQVSRPDFQPSQQHAGHVDNCVDAGQASENNCKDNNSTICQGTNDVQLENTKCLESSAYEPECDQSSIAETGTLQECEVVQTESVHCIDNSQVESEAVRMDSIAIDNSQAHVESEVARMDSIAKDVGPVCDSQDVSDKSLWHSEKSKQSSSNVAIEVINSCNNNENISLKQNICSSSPTVSESASSSPGMLDDELLSELDQELASSMSTDIEQGLPSQYTDLGLREQSTSPNGIVPLDRNNFTEWRELKAQLRKTADILEERNLEIERLKEEKECQGRQLQAAVKVRDSYLREVQHLRSNSQDDLYIPQIKELEYTIAKQQNENRSLKEKLATHDAAAKRAVATLQNECKLRIDQVTKMYEDAVREKDAMVVKYAQAEQKHLECQKMNERMEIRMKEIAKEKESIIDRAKVIKGEKQKLAADMETKTAEITSLTKELEKQKDVSSSLDVRIKWSQNKLKTELDSHKETKKQLEQTNLKLKETKEETDQIRRDCQRIIRTYQESEEIKSNSLDQKLKAKESELKLNLQEKSDQEEIYTKTIRELECLKIKHKETLTEVFTVKDDLQSLSKEKLLNEEALEKFRSFSQKQKSEIKELQGRIENLVQYQEDFTRAQGVIQTLDKEISELRISNKDLQVDMEACRRRETEKLELTSKLSRKNAELQSDNTNIGNKVMYLTSEIQTLKMELQEMDTKYKDISDRLQEEQKNKKEESDSLNNKLAAKTKSVEELTVKLQEEKDEIKTLKRKHVNNVKDLTRQLQQAKRKLEMYECNGERDTTSLGSRTSSNGSLNTVGMVPDPVSPPRPAVVQNTNPVNKAPGQDSSAMSKPVEIDKQMLIERIVRLQRAHARKNEKIEFMEDHINQLVNQIQKKSRIIQNYTLREESGTLTPDFMDYNKMQLSRKHSIMASLYRSHATDGAMTLDLSLEINRKLQAVLEDTLLKNITLKENIDTLGAEIARLSQENRKIQLQMHHKIKVMH